MTTATKERLRLDKFLKRYGSDGGLLTRIVGTTNQMSYSVSVRYHIRDYTPQELTDEIVQGDSHVIISSTEIIEAQWPGAQLENFTPNIDIQVAKKGDKFVTKQGRKTTVQAGQGLYLPTLVRIEMQVRGL